MEMAEIEDAEFKNHWLKCRFCLKNFNNNEKQAKITREIENKFFKMTQIEVNFSGKFLIQFMLIAIYFSSRHQLSSQANCAPNATMNLRTFTHTGATFQIYNENFIKLQLKVTASIRFGHTQASTQKVILKR
jgi:hypothetical protein